MLFAGVALALSAARAEAKPRVVDRIVAVVDSEIVLESEVRARVAPVLGSIALREPDAQKHESLREQAMRETLEVLIDERLEDAGALAMGIVVEGREIDAALGEVARGAGIDVPAVLAEAKKVGLDEPTYRAMLRMQIVEMKALMRRVPDVVSSKATDKEKAEAIQRAQAAWKRELREKATIEVRR